MSLTDRDRKIALALLPIIVLVAYWFLLLGPKREAASAASKDLAEQTQRRDAARSQVQLAQGAKTDFAADYGEIVRLGKAIPSGVDMPSLMVQLDRAAAGTGIRFTRIATGERDPAAAAAAPAAAPAAPSGEGQSTTPVQAGGDTAQSAPGSAVESANNTAQGASQQADAASQSGVAPSDTQTSTSSGSGLPVGGAAGTPGATTPTAGGTPGLDTVPLELEFVGNFFNLADFFHDIKRFVRVANENVVVSGRLITVEGVKWSSDPELFPKIKAEIKATVYLAPKTEGTTAGATPSGPAPATPGTTPASTPGSTPSAPPTATATP